MPKEPTLPADERGDELLFPDNTPSPTQGDIQAKPEGKKRDANYEPWKLMIIDDDEVIHSVSHLVLQDFTYKGRSLQIINGYSGEDARRLMADHPDTAVLLLDVVMETDASGLEAVRYIREELNNKLVRIILRTGQPGQAPEHEVIQKYDINDYREKSDLTSQKLTTAITTSLRAYDDILTIKKLHTSNQDLESQVEKRTHELSKANTSLKKQFKEHMRTLEALRQSEARLSEAQRIAGIGNFEWNTTNNTVNCSPQICRILSLNVNDEQIQSTEFLATTHPEDQKWLNETIAKATRTLIPYNIEYRIVSPKSEIRIIRQQGEIFYEADGRTKRIVGTIQDITDWRHTQTKMRRLSAAVEQTADGIMITDAEGIVEYINPAFTEMTGFTKEDLIGNKPSLLNSGKQSSAFYERLWKTILRGEVFSDIFINRRKNGSLYYEEKTITPQKNQNGDITSFISTGKDITERMEAQQRLYHMAHHDSLTGLPNRVLLQDRIDQAISRARWHKRNISVMFLDMDRFKVINDSLGHEFGDELLKDMSARLSNCIREGDTVARLGGDEFAIILNDIATEDDIGPLANKILNSLAEPYVIKGRELFITTSIGISLFPEDGDDSQMLLKKADAAMYHAKRQGRNNFQFYTKEEEAKAIERLTLETQLRRALERDEFQLHYQPQLRLRDCTINSMEALLRWHHPELKQISPMQFIPLLEETGMIIPVGEWVLHTACRQEKERQSMGYDPRKVAVNISIHQFKQKDFVDMIARILDDTQLAPENLELEVTEGALIDDIKASAAILHQLHEIGISLSIDDFGTGYSSMNYLRRLPFDSLKIDKSFVRDVTTNNDDAAIAAAIITLAHSIDLEVIAEGVETLDQLRFLHSLGCDTIQGYLCSPPLPSLAIMSLAHDDPAKWKTLLGTQSAARQLRAQ